MSRILPGGLDGGGAHDGHAVTIAVLTGPITGDPTDLASLPAGLESEAAGYERASATFVWDDDANVGRLDPGVIEFDLSAEPSVAGYAIEDDVTGELIVEITLSGGPTAGSAGWEWIPDDGQVWTVNDERDLAAEIARRGMPAGGTTGQVLAKTTGGDYDAGWVTPSGGGGGAGAVEVGFLAADVDMSGGSWMDLPLALGGTVPRAFIDNVTVLVVDGDDMGRWTVTASGPCTAGPELVLGQAFVAIAPGGGWASVSSGGGGGVAVAVYVTAAAMADAVGAVAGTVSTEATARIAGDAAEAEARRLGDLAAESLAATEHYASDARLVINSDWGYVGSPPDGAYTCASPGDFDAGLWLRAVVDPTQLVGNDDPADPSQMVYAELFTQTADGIGIWDNIEWAIEQKRDIGAERWRSHLFIEWTETGDTEETYSLSTRDVWEIPQGVTVEVATDLDFATGDVRFLLRSWFGPGDVSKDGADWWIVHQVDGAGATSIDTGVTEPIQIGSGQGTTPTVRLVAKSYDCTTTYVEATGALADAAGGTGFSFADGHGNTLAAGSNTTVEVPSTGGGAVDSVNGATGAVVLDAPDVGADAAGAAATALSSAQSYTDARVFGGSYPTGDLLLPVAGLKGGTRQIAAGQVSFVPLLVHHAVTVDALAIETSTAGSASANAYLYLCGSTGGRPGAVLGVTGSIDTTVTAGVLTGTLGTLVALLPGLYWLGYHAAAGTPATLRGYASSVQLEVLPWSAGTSGYSAVPSTGHGSTAKTTSDTFVGATFVTPVNQGPIVLWRAS